MNLPEVAGDPGSETANPALQKNVRESAFVCTTFRLLDDLGRDCTVALHDVTRNGFIAFIRCIGDHMPAVFSGKARGFFHRFVVVAPDANDLRAIRGDGLFTLCAHVGVQDDHTIAAERLCRGGESFAMVAVGRTDDDEIREHVLVASLDQRLRIEIVPGPQAQNQTDQRDRCAQSLEAAQWRADGLVLDAQTRHAKSCCRVGQIP